MSYYKTILESCCGELTEKKSKFICSICPVKTEQEAIDFINKIKSEHKTARHNTYAYILQQNNRIRYSDDGEPKSTAGLPMLQVLQKSELTDVAAVVTRYFGGILLGTGGLVRAYSEAVKIALEKSIIAKMFLCKECEIVVDYALYGKLEFILNSYKAVIRNCDYSDEVRISFYIKEEQFGKLVKDLNDTLAANFDLEVISEDFLPYEEV
ncbi:MAG: YigZ family protein [Clostridia bacterium]|nr:YigZ family protein [Clostridia bacterium]